MKRIPSSIRNHQLLWAVLSIFLLSSCLKDTRENLSTSPPLVGFLFPSPAFYPEQGGFVASAPLAFSSTAQTVSYDSTTAFPGGGNSPIQVELSYTGFPAPYHTNVQVTLAVDTSEIGAINSANGANFIMLPAGSYSLPNNSQVTITPAQLGNYPVANVYPQVITSMLDTTQQYILPLRIVAAPSGIVIASNLSGAAIQVVVSH
jgi:hypothetical protein